MKHAKGPLFDLTAISLMLVMVFGLSVATLLGPAEPMPGRPVLVIAPPWGGDASAIVTAAGGQLIGPVQAPLAALALFDGAVPVEDMRLGGAWGVRDGAVIARICGVDIT
ncbi:MAG: hypothetical protein QNJ09_04095 [Paracoccaceae bacterium]|nr:hypothetical protein [Paracoccaceae bacterium]